MDLEAQQATEALIVTLRRHGIRDERVLRAMSRLDRQAFMPVLEDERVSGRPDDRAPYEDEPQPIGYGQTISQPFVVAKMTEALELEGDERVLEVGTGSAYQTAVLSALCREVYTVEIVPELYRSAVDRLTHLRLDNVRVALRSGELGWPEAAPFNGIIVTAAPEKMPPELLEQLAPGGRLVIPVGPRETQELLRVRKHAASGELSVERLLAVRFVPLVPAAPSS